MPNETTVTATPPMLRYSILVSLCYLLLDGFIGGLLDHESFSHALLSVHDLQEWWMRAITIALIISFGIFGQKALKRQQALLHALDLSKKELQLLIESASEGILFLNGNEQVQIANPTICQLTGYTVEQLQQGDLHTLVNPRLPDATPLDSDHCPLCHLDPTTHDTSHIPHLLLTTAHSNTISVECWVRAVRNSENQFGGWLTTMIDIGKRVHAEQQSQQLLEDLQKEERRLKERNDELQRFAYVASHDLQEPLRMVSSFVQLLDRRYSAQLDDSAREFIGFAVDGTSRMQQMINDLLAYSRIGSKAKPLLALALQPLLDDAIANLKLAIEESGTTITIAPNDNEIMADESQMISLFQNLIANAIKFQPEGQAAEIAIDIRNQDERLCIAIRDNGIGIPPAYRSKVFEVFKRLHGRDKYSGSGIGLAVSRRIAMRHNGTLTIADQPEAQAGTTFVITLPRYRATDDIEHKEERTP